MRVRLRLAVAVGLLAFAFANFGPLAQTAAAYTWVWPTTGRITQPYGCTGFKMEPPYGSCRHFHKGIDIANDAGTKIRSASSGVVTYVGYNPYDPACCQAWIVKIKHDNGLLGLYAHMKPVRVDGARKGDRVKAGQLIGYMGATGMATGVHLHFGFFRNGVPKNPKNYITYSCCSLSGSSSSSTSADKTSVAAAAPAGGHDNDMQVEAPPDQAPAQPAVFAVFEKRYPLAL
jgi:murein DD-endopeptidase MepM/ murein hydrolase activator NlpD